MNKTRQPLNKEKILTAALQYADEKGLETLSMRNLAKTLKVQAMSLYNHIKNKEDLLYEMVDKVIGEFTIPQKGTSWKTAMETRAVSMYKTLIRHRWAALTILPRIHDGKNSLTFLNATIECLVEAQIPITKTDWAINVMDSYIYGFTIQQLNFPILESEFQQTAADYLPRMDKELYPRVYELTVMVSDGTYSGINNFEFGINLIIDGLEKRLLEKKE